LDFDPAPVTRAEYLFFFSIIGMTFEIIWLAVLILVPQPLIDRLYDWIDYALVYPLVVGLGPLLLAFLPKTVLESTRVIPAFLILSRERGDLRKWDLTFAALGAAGLALALLRLEGRMFVADVTLLSLYVLTMLGLTVLQERVDFSKRSWHIAIPDWLRRRAREGRIADDDPDAPFERGVLEPEPDATQVYDFEGRRGRRYPVGVGIDPQALDSLRQLNAQHGGGLYLTAPQAVVLMDRSPVPSFSPGRREVVALCKQIISIAEAEGLTPFLLADAVLRFVREAIRYADDSESTGEIPEGPFEEYGRFPAETLHDGVGDGDCTAILCASLLAHLGFDAALIHIDVSDPQTGLSERHLAVGLGAEGLFLAGERDLPKMDYIQDESSGARYLCGVTASERPLGFGVIPAQWREQMTVVRIDPIPAVTLIQSLPPAAP
jgi:hypothetical protein